jgi:lysyl-tRNA synthetase, class II
MQNLNAIKAFRLKKLAYLKTEGIDPYPARAKYPLVEINYIKANFKKLVSSKKKVAVAGRLLAKREHGGSVFLDILNGEKLQIFLGKDKIGHKAFKLFTHIADIGDFIAFSGRPFYTKRKEITLEAKDWQMLAKTILPLPEKWHGLQDIEERFRRRYLDILINHEVKDRFLLRSRIVEMLRRLLATDGFIEFETPILQPLYGGALAEPFNTHHNMLDMDMYLRIAPELYLKRLLTAGFNKIYEIGKNFRNEGLDTTHNPEFTTVELYEAYKDAKYLRKYIWSVLQKIIINIIGKKHLKFDGNLIKIPKKLSTISFWQVLERYAMIPQIESLSRDDLALRARQFGINPESEETKEKIADEIFKKIARPKIIQPIYIINYPVAMSPLAKNLNGKEDLVDRFQLIIGGLELINAFSELNDPEEQRIRMQKQESMRIGKDKEAHPMDEDFIEMLEYGMPPAAGLGMSIDRLTMLLSDTHNIKEVILFPTIKRKRL